MDVKNKVCIITGSAQGLGKAYAKILLDNGAKVCISDLNENTAKSTLEEFENRHGKGFVCFFKCDVTKQDQFEALFDQTEKYFNVSCIDILVNNAGILDSANWRLSMEVNIMAVMSGSDIAMQRMKKSHKKGSIVNIASTAGFLTGMGERSTGYFVSKHGVVALTRTLARTYAQHGVSIKALCPNWVNTKLVEKNKKDISKSITRQGGLLTPEYVAEGFYKLVTKFGNGAVMSAVKGSPFVIIPDDSDLYVKLRIKLMGVLGSIIGKDVVTVFQQKIFFFGIMVSMFLLGYFFFSGISYIL